MNKLLVMVSAFLLSGCFFATTPVAIKPEFPPVPDELVAACPDLKTIDRTNAQLSEVLDVVTSNYAQYRECQIKVDSWREWYTTQKKIYESVK